MKVAILTTETSHHTHFVREICKVYSETESFIEQNQINAPFATEHPFEVQRDIFEKKLFFDGKNEQIKTFSPANVFDSVNSINALKELSRFSPDIAIVFGTGKIGKELISLMPNKLINLHGGNPEEYRGLDTHLWSIYHGDYNELASCLHYIDHTLDTGNIISMEKIPLKKNMKLKELRAANTQVCIQMILSFLKNLNEPGFSQSKKQSKKGRYYSFMPSSLKEICVYKFEKFTETLK
jgi:methionyl-tRNA formyltransferase